jgi:hypothetical protein
MADNIGDVFGCHHLDNLTAGGIGEGVEGGQRSGRDPGDLQKELLRLEVEVGCRLLAEVHEKGGDRDRLPQPFRLLDGDELDADRSVDHY